MRNTAEKRHNDWTKAIRRKNILLEHQWEEDDLKPLHYYSKNQLWCTCWMCKQHTNNKKPQRRIYGSYMNWKISDQRKLNSMDEDLEDLALDNDENL